MTKPNTQHAKTLGSIAFAQGKKAIPAFDSELMEMIAGRQVGDSRTIPEIKAWTAGWVEACLAVAA